MVLTSEGVHAHSIGRALSPPTYSKSTTLYPSLRCPRKSTRPSRPSDRRSRGWRIVITSISPPPVLPQPTKSSGRRRRRRPRYSATRCGTRRCNTSIASCAFRLPPSTTPPPGSVLPSVAKAGGGVTHDGGTGPSSVVAGAARDDRPLGAIEGDGHRASQILRFETTTTRLRPPRRWGGRGGDPASGRKMRARPRGDRDLDRATHGAGRGGRAPRPPAAAARGDASGRSGGGVVGDAGQCRRPERTCGDGERQRRRRRGRCKGGGGGCVVVSIAGAATAEGSVLSRDGGDVVVVDAHPRRCDRSRMLEGLGFGPKSHPRSSEEEGVTSQVADDVGPEFTSAACCRILECPRRACAFYWNTEKGDSGAKSK